MTEPGPAAPGGKRRLPSRRSKRPARYVESIDFLAMVRRIVRAAGARVGQSDVDELRALVAIRADLDAAIVEAVRGLRNAGYTWESIGAELGITRQAALMYFNPRLKEGGDEPA